MATAPKKPKLLVIVGPTASGKSALALKIAQKFNGEIIAADSRTIYEGMNIGTAKPTSKQQKLVPHWGIDLIEPGQTFSAARFKEYASAKIEEIQSRGKLPILVGGTGLYVDSVLFNFSFIKSNKSRRLIYSVWSVDKLQKRIQQRGWPLPENLHNKRHLILTMERRGRLGSKSFNLGPNVLLVGIMPSDEILKQRISDRAGQMFESGIIAETKDLLKHYGRRKFSRTAGIPYKSALRVIDGEITEQNAKELIQKGEWQYARRQRTWFKRNKFIQWYMNEEEALTPISRLLHK